MKKRSLSSMLAMVVLTLISARPAHSTPTDGPTSKIANWQDDIPLSEQNIVQILESEAGYFSFETDEGVCGGDIENAKLIDHQVIGVGQDNALHLLTLKFQVTKALNYCAAVTTLNCDAQIQISSVNKIEMSDWTCY